MFQKNIKDDLEPFNRFIRISLKFSLPLLSYVTQHTAVHYMFLSLVDTEEALVCAGIFKCRLIRKR